MLSVIAIIIGCLIFYLGGMTATYVVCCLRYGGKPADRLGVYFGWQGGDSAVMLIFWPVTLAYQLVSAVGTFIVAQIDVRIPQLKVASKPRSKQKTPELRSGQDNGLYQ